MPPGPLTDLRANPRRSQALHGGLLAGLVALMAPLPAWAQESEATAGQAGTDDLRAQVEREREQAPPTAPLPPQPDGPAIEMYSPRWISR